MTKKELEQELEFYKEQSKNFEDDATKMSAKINELEEEINREKEYSKSLNKYLKIESKVSENLLKMVLSEYIAHLITKEKLGE